MGRMDFIADERVVPPVTTKQPMAQYAAGMGLTAMLFWGKNQHVPEKVRQDCKIFHFLRHFVGIGIS